MLLRHAQDGVLTSAQAAGLLGPELVRGHLRQGRWRRICRGVLLTGNGELTAAQQRWVAVLVGGADAMLAGAAAAEAGGVRGLRTDPITVLVPAARSASRRLPRLPPDMPGVRVYRSSVLPQDHRQVGSPPRTTMARSVVDAAVWAPSDRAAQVILAAACQQRCVTPTALLHVLTVLTRVRRRAFLRTTLSDIAGGAQALAEIDLMALCRRYHLPLPEMQHRRRTADGRSRYLDAYWRKWQLHVEVDGAHHMDAAEWSRDMVRQNQIWIAGDRILRFPAWLIRTDPKRVADQLRVALQAADPRPD
jgi:very-short-patch-repair endonuclease